LNADADTLFSLEAETADMTPVPDEPRHFPALAVEEMCMASAAAHSVAYHWHIPSDVITWSANAAETLGCSLDAISTGRKFATMLAADNITSRYDTVIRSSMRAADAQGEAFEIEYQFKPKGRGAQQAMWIEDHGRWFGGVDGTPTDVFGTMKLADKRHVREQELNFLSTCDVLTGMMNRGRMLEALDEAIRNAQSEKSQCAFAIVAVNNLDIMNEAYGFEVADEVIVALAERLRRVMRVGDSIARYSGSKFGIILNGCKNSELAPALERFMKAVRDSVIETRFGPVWALLSIGSVSLPALGETSTAAAAHAEEALSEAFRLPSDGYVIYTTSEERQAQRLLNARCATEIVSCLRDGLFQLAYQPVVDTKTGKAVFHEALLRMADATGAMITAGHLVPIAERLGLIRLIDRSVLQQALNTLRSHPTARLSINISATTANDPRWNKQLLDLLAEVPELASRLIVEVTETSSLGDLSLSRDFVRGLKAVGCGIAIDDFGAGFTSYRNLKELPITLIKLDGHFCRGLKQDPANAIYVKSMVDLAHAFGISVVAEWVEDIEDAEGLSALGVDFIQGNLTGEPSIAAPWSSDDHVSHFDWREPVTQPEPLHHTVEDIEAIVPVVVEEATVETFAVEVETTDVVEATVTDEDVENSLNLLKSVLAEFQSALDEPEAQNDAPEALAS
jgi:diguanylate cyclase (GGDEF)-like protein